jgi:sugar fermentation stimulation protein A
MMFNRPESHANRPVPDTRPLRQGDGGGARREGCDVVQARFMSVWTTIGAPRLGVARWTPLRATFIERPHRFAAICRRRSGEIVAAHVPNPGRLTGVIAPRCEVLLDGPFPPPRSLVYTMVASRPADVWIGTNTMYANRVFPSLIRQGLFPEIDPGPLRSEVPWGRSRFDFAIGSALVEVKSVTLADARAAKFPDAVSLRAARHCDELAGLTRGGRPCAIVFVAQRGDAESVAPEDSIDPAFGIALRAAADAGVLVMSCALDMTPAGAIRARRVPLLL